MSRNLILLLAAAALVAGTTACEKKPDPKQIQAEKVQAFRNKQKIEAIKSYTALVTKYPDSEYAPKAQERLNVLGPLPAATPAPKKK